MVAAWLARGRPAGRETIGMFEGWARIVGGVLDVAGIPGFLGNVSSTTTPDPAGDEWRRFAAAWWDAHRQREVTVNDLYLLACRYLDLGDGSPHTVSVIYL